MRQKTIKQLRDHLEGCLAKVMRARGKMSAIGDAEAVTTEGVSPECQAIYDIWQAAKEVAEMDASSAAASAEIAAAAEQAYYDCESP